MRRGLILILMLLNFEVLVTSGFDTIMNPAFDMKGTITNVLSPSSIVIGGEVVNLAGVDPTDLYGLTYFYLMEDLKRYYMGKDVLVKGNYVYFDLNGAYNSQSLNEMIQKEISVLQEEPRYVRNYGRHYRLSSGSHYTG